MNKVKYFIGCDVSKDKLNFAILLDGSILEDFEIANTQRAIRKWIKQISKIKDFCWTKALVCLENTGIYNNHLLEVLNKKEITVVVENAVNILQSLGLTRGKNDLVDAQRIAEYAFRFTDRLKVFKPSRKVMVQLKELTTCRNRLVKVKSQLKTPLKEAEDFLDKATFKMVSKTSESSIKAIEADIKNIEKQIQGLIDNDQNLKDLQKFACSVKGVGKQMANKFIIETGEFTKITDPKKMACHAGVAPFQNSSGSSIRGKNKVSHKANKELKSLLHLGALSAIQHDKQIKEYFLRKTAEGKNKMSVINAVRNKLIHRVFAVVKNRVMYQENYKHNLQVS